ncbi:prefoldin subunit 2 [Suhomyces tanzawaensis NRRL Y-17324]|uniref:Prefoldin subunit 2 n=1 Tax=Suhomyces tanzawaensis NRRL Y-17324 TaxID=984487 RepID=A0A1E4SP92_9ASCO|nr:prefoldin subunit 2 [Suhomyces tanzawaensis NRRL Y-17324]ODV81341.1 prefoldin subunit 2 [Suhomyces tanzawaensis NRRL Y-17324]
MSTTEAEKQQKAANLQNQYNQFQEIISELESQLISITSKIEEHLIVDKTLNETPKETRENRKCFKMVGGVLVNKTVDEVIAILKEELSALVKEKNQLEELLIKSRKEREEWMKNNNVKIVRQN